MEDGIPDLLLADGRTPRRNATSSPGPARRHEAHVRHWMHLLSFRKA